MPTFDQPVSNALEAREALRHLAHSTRMLDDPTQIYAIIGDITNGLASLAQSLHQIADFHEGPLRHHAAVAGDLRGGRAASYQVAWELHRAAEMLSQVGAGIDRAHEVEATIAYEVPDVNDVVPPVPPSPPLRPSAAPGLSL